AGGAGALPGAALAVPGLLLMLFLVPALSLAAGDFLSLLHAPAANTAARATAASMRKGRNGRVNTALDPSWHPAKPEKGPPRSPSEAGRSGSRPSAPSG